MKVSLKWLSQYVDLSGLSPQAIAERLTFAGVEVEGIDRLAVGDHLVIARVLTCTAMPESDHLHLCTVDEGPVYGVTDIVCGAPNVQAGQNVIVSRPGATLAVGKIGASTIKGHPSNGMICSLLELGVDRKFLSPAQIEGIEVLPADAEIGREDVLAYLGLDDTVLDLKLLANRSDCLAIANVAKEVGALFDRPVSLPKPRASRVVVSTAHVRSLTPKCPQFSIKIIRGVSVAPSPAWLQAILRAEGVRPINNLVDIGNYVMLLTGQPLHMYDLDKLPSADFIVKDDYEGPFVALDDQTYAVQKGDIVITVEGQPMCLGGIMGAAECAVDEKTKAIAIEAANFDGATIRRSSIRLNLASESSQRFVKGINPHQYDYVLLLTAELVKTLAGSALIEGIATYDKVKHDPLVLAASAKRINGRLGTSFSKEEILGALEKVGVKITHVKGNRFHAKIPAHRIDMTGEADLSEEVIRLLGFEHVKSVLPRLDTTVGLLSETQRRKKLAADFLLGRGLDEILTYTLVNRDLAEAFRTLNHEPCYALLHPMTDDHVYVRANLLASVLETVSYNIARQNRDLAFFEVSDVITSHDPSTHLAIVLTGEKSLRGMLEKRPVSFADVKGLFEGLMSVLGIEVSRYKIEPYVSDKDEFHPGRTAAVRLGKKLVAVFGELHPQAVAKYDLGKGTTVALELDLSAFTEMRTNTVKAVAPARYPAVERDLALVVDRKVTVAEILRTARMAGRELVKKVDVFDIYQGSNLPEDKKSVAITITYQDPAKTLVEAEIVLAEERIKQELYRAYGVTIRS